MRILRLSSADDLCRHAWAWDDLWWRSETALPTLRAEALALWLRQFAPRARFQALVVEQDGQFVAALPLVGRRVKRILPAADLPNNLWSASGDLLLDPSCQVEPVLDRLLAAAVRSPNVLLWFDAIAYHAPRWKAWLETVRRAGLGMDLRVRHEVGVIERSGDWAQYTEACLSGDFRRNVRRRLRQLEERGEVTLRACLGPACGELTRDQLDALVRRAFKIEDNTWKGSGGTSVLRTPGMIDFFLRQARLLAGWGQWALYCLEHNGQPVAFEFGYYAKGTYFPHKISYLDELAKLAPGHSLRFLQLQSLWRQEEFRAVDFFGVLTDATRRWITGSYPLARLVIATRRPLSRALVAAYSMFWPHVRTLCDKWRKRQEAAAASK